MEKPRVGFIGVGNMGGGMSRCLLRAGFSVTVYDRDARRAADLTAVGASVAASPQEVAESADVVITMLPDTPDVEETVRASNGLMHVLRRGSVYIDMSTISPTVSKGLAVDLAEKGIEMLDAPVTGNPRLAPEGALGIMVGGKREVFERCVPLFQAIGKRILYVGQNGSGHTMKLINNLIAGSVLPAVCEALVLATKAGLDPKQVAEITAAGGARTGMLETRGPTIFARSFDTVGFALRLMDKDLRLASELARDLQIAMPVAGVAREMYRAAMAAGLGGMDDAAVIKVSEALNGIEVLASS